MNGGKLLCIGKEKIAALTSVDIPEDAIVICPNPKPIPKLVPMSQNTEEYFKPVARNARPKHYMRGAKNENNQCNQCA